MVAIGLQPEAAQFAGIRVNRIKFWLFVLSGVVCAFAGILLTLQNASVSYDAGTGARAERRGDRAVRRRLDLRRPRHDPRRRPVGRHRRQPADGADPDQRLARQAEHRHRRPAADQRRSSPTAARRCAALRERMRRTRRAPREPASSPARTAHAPSDTGRQHHDRNPDGAAHRDRAVAALLAGGVLAACSSTSNNSAAVGHRRSTPAARHRRRSADRGGGTRSRPG